jgi:hypothetical protein
MMCMALNQYCFSMNIGYRKELVVEWKYCTVGYKISIAYEMTNVQKFDPDCIALISRNGLEEIEYRSDKRTESQLRKMRIHSRLRENRGETGYSRVTLKRQELPRSGVSILAR